MKQSLALAAVLLLGFGSVGAALTPADLAPEAIRTNIAAQPAAQRQAYAREVLQAIAASPADAAAKTQALTSASRALIAGAGADQGIAIIAEIYNSIPMENLPAVADLLATANFGQAVNGFSDEQFDAFCSKLVKGASEYIEASGTDSPTARVGVLVASFAKASSDAKRTAPALLAQVPESLRAAVTLAANATLDKNTEVLAAATGVDEIADVPADPDSDNVVQAAQAQAAAATAQSPAQPAPEAQPAAQPAPETPDGTVTTMKAESAYLEDRPAILGEDGAAADSGEPAVEVQVPLLSRFSTDVLGLTLDAMSAAMYDWDTGAPLPATLPGLGTPDPIAGIGQQIPENFPRPRPIWNPSPSYGNQEINRVILGNRDREWYGR